MDKNHHIYNSPEIIQKYVSYDHFTKPEIAVFDKFRDDFPKMKILDIGIGGGRTTSMLAPIAGKYTGIDYSEGMIEACKKKFKSVLEKNDLLCCDARDMNIFREAEFDFIIFSFNGIDSVPFEDRDKILKEVKRVGKNNAYFFFSSHNLQYIDRMVSLQIPLNPLRWLDEIKRYRYVRRKNDRPESYYNKEYAFIHDNACETILFSDIAPCYIRPVIQRDHLANMDFANIEIYSLKKGRIIYDDIELEQNNDPWLYYLCQVKK